MGVYYHPRLTTSREFFPQLGRDEQEKSLKNSVLAKQGVCAWVFKGAEFENALYFVLRPLLHYVLA